MSVTKDMTIEEILGIDNGIADMLMDAGMHCLSCALAHGEDLETACLVHGIDADAMVGAINDYLDGQ